MEYKIYNGETLIAQFNNSFDRDLCLEVFEEEFPDYNFTKEEQQQ